MVFSMMPFGALAPLSIPPCPGSSTISGLVAAVAPAAGGDGVATPLAAVVAGVAVLAPGVVAISEPPGGVEVAVIGLGVLALVAARSDATRLAKLSAVSGMMSTTSRA